MSDLRIIVLNEETGEVEISARKIYQPLTELEEAIQRLVVCLMNTPGTMVDAPSWGGGAMRLYLSLRENSINKTKKRVEEVIHQAQTSLSETEPNTEYRIVNLNLVDVELKERGYSVSIRVDFSSAMSKTIVIPGRTDVVS